MGKWDYAQLSKQASEFGGLEKFVQFLEEANRQKGRKEMLSWIGVTAIGASLLTTGIIKITTIVKKHKEDIEFVRKELIDGIKNHDLKTNNNEERQNENE